MSQKFLFFCNISITITIVVIIVAIYMIIAIHGDIQKLISFSFFSFSTFHFHGCNLYHIGGSYKFIVLHYRIKKPFQLHKFRMKKPKRLKVHNHIFVGFSQIFLSIKNWNEVLFYDKYRDFQY